MFKKIVSRFNSTFYKSFFIRVDKKYIYVKCFENNSWVRCSTTFEVNADKKYQIVRISSVDTHEVDINLPPPSGHSKKVTPFNHPRLIYHQFELSEIFMRFLIRQLSKWWKSTNCIIFQLGYKPEGGLTDVEAKMLAESLEHCGAKQCYIVDPSHEMTENQIEDLYSEINSSRIKKWKKISPEASKRLSWPITL